MKKKIIAVILAAMMCGGTFTAFAKGEATKPNPDIGKAADIIEEVEEVEPECEVVLTEAEEKALKEKEEKLKKWYDSLTDEQKEYFERKSSDEELQRELKWQAAREKERDSMVDYLRKNLKKNCYTYLNKDSATFLEIGVPSVKYIEKIDEVILKQNKKAKTNISVSYRLCKYSLEELEKTKAELEKNVTFKKAVGKEPAILMQNGHLTIYFPYGTPKAFSDWLSKSTKYKDVIVVCENMKANPE